MYPKQCEDKGSRKHAPSTPPQEYPLIEALWSLKKWVHGLQYGIVGATYSTTSLLHPLAGLTV